MNQRFEALQAWLTRVVGADALALSPLAGDASFRRYYRLALTAEQHYIIMDAPPGIEEVKPFIAIAQAFTQLGVCVPQVLASDIEQGFLMLSDFGDRLYLAELTDANADQLYGIALTALAKIQRYQPEVSAMLPVFGSAAMRQELSLFEEWFLTKHVEVVIPEAILQQVYQLIFAAVESQPQCCIHRDYHSRNLMVLPNNQVGILDFQDAAWGPITYDIISLVKDSYIDWPRQRVVQWAQDFWAQSRSEGILPKVSFEQYLYWFDLMALQRHLKVLFIFARKFHRDGSTHYLQDIPRTLQYVLDIANDYPQLSRFKAILEQEVAPKVLRDKAAA